MPGRTGLEPELGGRWRDAEFRTGLEPELGGDLRQRGVYVDEIACIGCQHCVHTAPNTFYIESEYGRARAFRQDGDSLEVVEEAIDTCPVNCISWIDFTGLQDLEDDRQHQVMPIAGFPVNASLTAIRQRKSKERESK